ncbi:hypothetical protein CLAIMM_02580 [Cladophialophora immunda]|nr:hypothetical protein CLAIMM_02580 [Cladophialophora immunda]
MPDSLPQTPFRAPLSFPKSSKQSSAALFSVSVESLILTHGVSRWHSAITCGKRPEGKDWRFIGGIRRGCWYILDADVLVVSLSDASISTIDAFDLRPLCNFG